VEQKLPGFIIPILLKIREKSRDSLHTRGPCHERLSWQRDEAGGDGRKSYRATVCLKKVLSGSE